MRGVMALFVVCVLGTGAAGAAPPSVGDYLDSLQARDNAAFPDSLFEFNRVRADSVLGELDSRGLTAMDSAMDSAMDGRIDPVDVDLGLWIHGTYSRVGSEALGASLNLSLGRHRLTSVSLNGGWSFSREEVRYLGAVSQRLGRRSDWSLEGRYQDLIEPFGSNRVTANGLRALVGGADDQDYLNRIGGRGGVRWEPGTNTSLFVGAGSHDEEAVGVEMEFGLFEDMSDTNLAADEGRNTRAFAELDWGDLFTRRHAGRLRYGVSGGALGGDFDYYRVDGEFTVREYVEAGHEWVVTARGAHTGAGAPVQALADLGGLSTVRGYPRRSLVGESSAAVRWEWLVPYDVFRAARIPLLEDLRIQLVPWGDTGRVWNGNRSEWLSSFGIGLQSYIGPIPGASQIRLDVAFPTGPDRPEDATVYFRFAGGGF